MIEVGEASARILDAIEEQLQHEPTKTTRNRKPMRPDRTPFIAPWELRVDDRINSTIISAATGCMKPTIMNGCFQVR